MSATWIGCKDMTTHLSVPSIHEERQMSAIEENVERKTAWDHKFPTEPAFTHNCMINGPAKEEKMRYYWRNVGREERNKGERKRATKVDGNGNRGLGWVSTLLLYISWSLSTMTPWPWRSLCTTNILENLNRLHSSYRYATIASIRCTSVLKLRILTCWLLLASIANGSVSTHSPAGTSAESDVYARMLKTVGSWMTGRYVTIEIICLRIARISDWISASGLGTCLTCHQHYVAPTSTQYAYGSEESAGGSTNLTSNTHRSSGIRPSFEMMASTSCVTEPVRSHSIKYLEPMCPSE